MRYVNKAIVADVADREVLNELSVRSMEVGGGGCRRVLRDDVS